MRGLLRIGLLAVIGISAVSLCFTVRKGVESDLFALIGSSAEVAELRSAADAMAKSAHFLVKAESEEAARARLSALGALDPASAMDGSQLSSILTSLAPYARGFLSPTVKGQLERGEFAAVRDAAVARLFYCSPIMCWRCPHRRASG